MTQSRRDRLAIVGCGTAVRSTYLHALKRLRWRPVCLVDRDPATARRLAGRSSVVVADDPAKVLDAFDAAIVTVSTCHRSRICRDLVNNGKHVLVDMPLTVTAEDMQHILAAARATGTVVACTSYRRHARAAQWIKSLLQDKILGAIVDFDVRDGTPYRLPVRSADHWRRQHAGGGVLIETGVHTLDLLMWWLGNLSILQYKDDSYGGVEADAMATLSTPGGATGVVEFSRTRTLRNTAVIRGEHGWVELDLREYRVRADPDDLLDRVFIGQCGRSCSDRSHTALHAAKLLDWRRAIAGAARPSAQADAAVETIALLDACYRMRDDWTLPWLRPLAARLGDTATVPDAPLKGRTVLVTGATGFIGTRAVEKLVLEQGAKPRALVRDYRRAARIARFDVEMPKADLRDAAAVSRAVARCDTVFHLAFDVRRSAAENLAGVNNLADACMRHNVRRVVHVSSIAVYDSWPDADLTELSSANRVDREYKGAKLAIEREILRRASDGALPAVVLQPTIVYGPFSWLWTDHLVSQLRSGTVILPDEGQGLCNAVYVDDVVDAMVLAATRANVIGETFIVSGPNPVTWDEFFQAYADALSVDSVQYIDAADLAQTNKNPLANLKLVLANPQRVATWRPARLALNKLREMLGDEAIDRLRTIAAQLGRATTRPVYLPSGDTLALYSSRGRCHIDKARVRLDYAPSFHFGSGSKLTADYVRWAYPQTVEKAGR